MIKIVFELGHYAAFLYRFRMNRYAGDQWQLFFCAGFQFADKVVDLGLGGTATLRCVVL